MLCVVSLHVIHFEHKCSNQDNAIPPHSEWTPSNSLENSIYTRVVDVDVSEKCHCILGIWCFATMALRCVAKILFRINWRAPFVFIIRNIFPIHSLPFHFLISFDRFRVVMAIEMYDDKEEIYFICLNATRIIYQRNGNSYSIPEMQSSKHIHFYQWIVIVVCGNFLISWNRLWQGTKGKFISAFFCSPRKLPNTE